MRFFQALLWVSLLSLILCGATALTYELYAVVSKQTPPISSIVVTWITGHRLLATGIAAMIVAFLFWLILHWFGPQGGMLER